MLKPDFHSRFSLVASEIFAWDMRRVVKRIEQDKKIFPSVRISSSNISTSAKFPHSETNQTSFLSHADILRGSKKFSQNGRPTALSGLREDRPQNILKTRIIELQTSYRLRQFFAGTLRKWRLIFPPKYFFSNENNISDR